MFEGLVDGSRRAVDRDLHLSAMLLTYPDRLNPMAALRLGQSHHYHEALPRYSH